MSTLNEGAVTAALKDVQDPELGKSLSHLRMIDQIRITPPGTVLVKIELPTHAYPRRERLTLARPAQFARHLVGTAAIDAVYRLRQQAGVDHL